MRALIRTPLAVVLAVVLVGGLAVGSCTVPAPALSVSTVLSGLHRPWDLAFTPDGRRLEGVGLMPDTPVVPTLAERRGRLDPALDCAAAIALGAILAPTDPVLASSVTVGHSQDNDRLRYALSGEAGLNDGAAFPFVVLGLLLLGPTSLSEIASWAGLRLLWAVPAGLLLGYVLGRLVGSAAIALWPGSDGVPAGIAPCVPAPARARRSPAPRIREYRRSRMAANSRSPSIVISAFALALAVCTSIFANPSQRSSTLLVRWMSWMRE